MFVEICLRISGFRHFFPAVGKLISPNSQMQILLEHMQSRKLKVNILKREKETNEPAADEL